METYLLISLKREEWRWVVATGNVEYCIIYDNINMSFLNTDLIHEKAGDVAHELPAVCVPVYKCIVEEMAGLIDDGQLRNIFYSLMLGARIGIGV